MFKFFVVSWALITMFTIGVVSEPMVRRAQSKFHAAVSAEERANTDLLEIKRLEKRVSEMAAENTRFMERAIAMKLDADRDAWRIGAELSKAKALLAKAEDSACFLQGERDRLQGEVHRIQSALDAERAELARVRDLVTRVGSELNCVEQPASVLAAE